jgi:hypothetical protein
MSDTIRFAIAAIHISSLFYLFSHQHPILYSDEPPHKDGLYHGDDKEELYPPGTLRVRDDDHGFVGRGRRWIGQENVFQRTELDHESRARLYQQKGVEQGSKG